MARDLIEHVCCIEERVVPELSAHLFVGDVSACHLHQCMSAVFDKAVAGLVPGRYGDDPALFLENPLESFATNELLI